MSHFTTTTVHCDSSLLKSSKGPLIWPVTQFEKDYELVRPLGKGQYGQVLLAKGLRKNDEFLVAAKFMKCKKAAEKLRVREEIDILSELDHPNILKLIGAYEDEENFVQVVEYLGGGELFERIVEKGGGELSEWDIGFGFVRQICQGCAYLAAKKVAHLDLKPENVVCSSNLPDFIVKIVDFGFARRVVGNEPVKVMQGTPEFVSPEVVNYEAISLVTDTWSLGVMTYVLLSGLSPFLGDNNQETYNNIVACDYTMDEPEFEDVSEEAKNFITRLLVLDQSERMSAQDALNHAWFANKSALKKPVSKCQTDRLAGILARLKWQKCTKVIVACARLKQGINATIQL